MLDALRPGRVARALADRLKRLDPSAEAREEQERLRDCLRAAADFIWETDAELRLVYLSSEASRVLGRPVASLLGRRWKELLVRPANGRAHADELLPFPDARGRFVPGEPFRDLRCTYLGPDGRLRTLEASGVPLRRPDGRLAGYRGVAREVSERARAEQRLRFLAGHDPLTGAANRALLATVAERTIERARASGERVALVLIDLDRFKELNDALGHAAGDAVLRVLARRLREAASERDLVARVGGDEFALLIGGLDPTASLDPRLALLERRLTEPIPLEEGEVVLGASFGVALWPEDGLDLAGLLARADAAMYRAKRAGRTRLGDEPRRAASLPAPG
ncbi:MAG: diguanylate cyclase [Geminicoccaceae bacterium]|nr:diguanylate cyclase [Geminicoccaceae bacterium]MCX8102086.1 diguanylate cyclase [Geminicoccaceae bacterium]MDW8369702.1 diguanylate cyclase [Geminicoccaceae bacterium]